MTEKNNNSKTEPKHNTLLKKMESFSSNCRKDLKMSLKGIPQNYSFYPRPVIVIMAEPINTPV